MDEVDIEWNALGDVFQYGAFSLSFWLNYSFNPSLLFTANDCISLLVRRLGIRVSPEGVEPCLDLLKDQVDSAGHYEYPLLISSW